LAWQKVRSSRGSAGVDRASVERFAARAEEYLAKLADDLRAGRYRTRAIRRVQIFEGDGRKRPLGIPTVKDRIVRLH
jgi:RNA-directed DNA polymerase